MIVELPVRVGLLPLRTAELRRRARDGKQVAEIAGLLFARGLGGIAEGAEAQFHWMKRSMETKSICWWEIAPDLA